MSLDLSWSLIDDSFVKGLLDKLNDVLSNASRPEYIGPIVLSNLVLGHEAPDVSIVNVGDVWETFLQRDEASMTAAAAAKAKTSKAAPPPPGSIDPHRNGRSLDTSAPADGVRRDGHLARFANKNLPFSAVRSDSPGPGAQYVDDDDDMDDDVAMYSQDKLSPPPLHDDVPVRRRSGGQRDYQARRGGDRRSAPRHHRIEVYRQYSDSGQIHRVDAGSVSSFDGYSSVAPSGVTTPNPWGAGLPYAAAHGGYFSAWQGGGYAPSAAGVPLPPSIRSAPHSRRTSWQRQSSASNVTGGMSRTRLPSPSIVGGGGGGVGGSMISPPSMYPGMLPPASTYAGWSSNRGGVPLLVHSPNHHDESGIGNSGNGGANALPSLQLQLSLHWTTQSLRLTLNTSLVINHPSPAFMSLPLTITITGLSLGAGGILAFEVDPVTNDRRCHFCLLVEEEDDDDDAEDAVDAAKEPNMAGTRPAFRRPGGMGSTTAMRPGGTLPQPTPGERVVYNLSLETSVGQADKHVLKNVTKVERFVVSLIRKAITDELIFPNFYSIELP